MKHIYITIILILSVSMTWAQERANFRGSVVDEKGDPLIGATVVEMNSDGQLTGNGTAVDMNGNFVLPIKLGTKVKVSFIGYVDQVVTFAKKFPPVTVRMKPSDVSIDEVQVVSVGFGEQDKKTITGSVGSFKAAELVSEMTTISAENILQGKIPGVSVQFTTGDPTKKPIILIRGLGTLGRNDANKVSSPLFVIDGVEMSNLSEDENPLETINPEDIEDFSVLKDASAAAIYGSKAANGVIIINTKRGVMGKPTINITNNFGINFVGQLKNTAGGNLERRQKVDLWERYNSQVNLPIHLTDSINPFWNNSTNWQDEVFRPATYVSNTVAIRAAGKIGNYSLSLNNKVNNGNRKNSKTERQAIRFLSDLRLWDNKLKISTQLNFSRNNNSKVSNASEAGVGTSSLEPSLGSDILASLEQVDNRRRGHIADKLVTSFGVKLLEPIPHVIFNTNLDYTYGNTSLTDRFRYDVAKGDSNIDYTVKDGSSEYNNLTNNTTINYFNDFDKLNLNFIVGQSIQYYNEKSRYSFNDVRYSMSNSLSTTPVKFTSSSSGYGANTELSYFSRLNLKYDDRYLLAMSVRADGSSKFGVDNRWGYFPSGSVGWVFSEEDMFARWKKIVSYGKVRVSWGVTGKTFYNNYLAQGIMQNTVRSYMGYPGIMPNFIKGGFQNKDLSWETSEQWDVGLDLEFFKNLFELKFDYYRKLNKDVLLDRALPNTSGYTLQDLNSASIVNQGFEFSVKATLMNKDKFRWEADLNVASNDNFVKSIYGTNEDIRRVDSNGSSTGTLIRVGEATNSLYYYRSTGIYQTESEIPINPATGRKMTFLGKTIKPGFPIYVDRNGDYTINYLDRGVEGDPNPKFIGGFNTYLYYKNWYLYVNTTFLFKRDIINSTLVNSILATNKNATGAMPDLSQFSIWQNGGDEAVYPSINPWAASKPLIQDARYIEDGSYFKIGSVTLGYRIKDAKWFKNMKIYSTVSNLHTFHRFSGANPEVVNSDGTYTNDYPLPLTVAMGLNIVF